MSDIAEKLLEAIADKEMKAMVADSTAYDDAGDPVTAAGSFSWHVEFDSLSTWVQDGAGENVALASDVDPSMEDWTKMTHGRVEFIADNDPAGVLRSCAADREIVEKYLDHKRRIAEYVARHFGQGEPLSDHERATWETLDCELSGYSFAVHARARGYGVTP